MSMPLDMPSEMEPIPFPPGAASPPPEAAPPSFTTGVEVHATPALQGPSIYYSNKFLVKYKEVDAAIRKGSKQHLSSILERVRKEKEEGEGVNLSGDPLLSVIIAYRKMELAQWLVPQLLEAELIKGNKSGDTALHAAAANGDMAVAEAIVKQYNELTQNNKEAESILDKQNKQQETALHKAALYGKRDMFWKLVDLGSNVDARGWEGASVLHCAIMGSAFELAWEIAKKYRRLMYTRNSEAVTPLQLIVTIPKAFRSMQYYGPVESLIYKWIPLEDNIPTSNAQEGDLENQSECEPSQIPNENLKDVGIVDHSKGRYFPSNYDFCLDLLCIIFIVVKWMQVPIFNLLKRVSPTVQRLERHKRRHEQAMNLIALLAGDQEYWDFLTKGIMGSPNISTESIQKTGSDTHEPKKEEKRRTRWDDSPLILGAKKGLDKFVRQILIVRPEAALLSGFEGQNVLQVAIQNGNQKIVEIVENLATGYNPTLPSYLLSSRDAETKSTILHFAAETTVKEEEATALQMQYELQWFEKVRKLVPKDLKYSRNKSEKTAQELFTENHQGMVKKCKDQIMEMGKTCSGIVAAVVFASSFSIPGERISNNVPAFHNKVAFKVFANAYVIGLSSASTAMVLFLSLLVSSYKERDFRRDIPTKYFFATTSFFLALVALLVSFSCNIFLSIYGSRRAEIKDIVPFICELTILPALSFLILLYRGTSFGVGPFIAHVWR